jgi:hypothetical protein
MKFFFVFLRDNIAIINKVSGLKYLDGRISINGKYLSIILFQSSLEYQGVFLQNHLTYEADANSLIFSEKKFAYFREGIAIVNKVSGLKYLDGRISINGKDLSTTLFQSSRDIKVCIHKTT